MSTPSQIKVLAVDDHPLLRAGIVAVIHQEEDMQVVAEASSGREAMDLFRKHSPDVTLMDVQLPDVSGIEVIDALRRQRPCARFIVLTTFEGDVLARRALRAGATGYLLKSMIRKELVDAIRVVHAGEKHIPSEIATQLAVRFHEDELSAREIQVLKAVAEGGSNKRIASQLSISEETVKAHMKSILQKLGASDRTHAVGIATSRGSLI